MIKSILYFIVFLSFLGCKDNEMVKRQISNDTVTVLPNISASDDIGNNKCLANFIKFRYQIYNKKKAQLELYFSFPIKNPDIWNLIFIDAENSFDTNRPFLSSDLKEHFDKFFTKNFINALLKIKAKQLFNTGKYTTPILVNDFPTTTEKYSIISEYSEIDKTLTLTLYTEYYEDSVKDGETSYSYYFELDDNCNIKFKNLKLAG